MSLLAGLFLSASTALAFPQLSTGPCPFPCTGITIGPGSTIVPDDWFALEFRELGGNLNWFRVELTVSSGELRAVVIGGYELSERYYSREESYEGTAVYYVPAVQGAVIDLYGDERTVLDMVFDGAEKANF